MDREKTLEVTDTDQVSPEKGTSAVFIEDIQVFGLDPNDAEFYANFSEERRKKLIRKVCFLPLLPGPLSKLDLVY